MLDYEHRFHGLGSLSYVYRRGRVVRGAYLALKYSLNSRRSTYRVAVVVSRKVDKSAVVRNRIRRRIYEIIRLSAGRIERPYDLIVSVYSDTAATVESRELERAVRSLLKKAGVLGGSRPTPHAIVKREE